MIRSSILLNCVLCSLTITTSVYAESRASSRHGDHLESALIHIIENQPTGNVISDWRQAETSVVLTVAAGYQVWEVQALVRETFEHHHVEVHQTEVWIHYASLNTVLQALSTVFLRSSPFRVARGGFIGCVLLQQASKQTKSMPTPQFNRAPAMPWRITSSGVGDVEIGKPLPDAVIARMGLTRQELNSQGRRNRNGFLVLRLEHMSIEVTLLNDETVMSIRPGIDVRTDANVGIGSDIRAIQSVYDLVTLDVASEPYSCAAASPDLPGVRFVFTDCEKACAGESRVRDVVWTYQNGRSI